MSAVLGADLRQRATNFETRAKDLAEKDRRKAEKERVLQRRAQQRRERHERAVAELRARQAEEAEQVRRLLIQRNVTQAELARQEALEHNRGISISATLHAVPLAPEVASAKGIRRAADKVILPAWLSGELMKQGAHEAVGQAFWRISAPDGRATCASVLEFSAPDGVVMLPPKTIAHGEVRVEYRRLETGTFVRLTPQSAAFQQEVAEQELDLEALLASSLQLHSTLSEGDWLDVALPGGPQRLQVMELSPAPHVSILHTDLEADVTPSREFIDRIEAEQAAARAAAARAAEVEAEAARLRSEAAERARQDAEATARQAADVARRRSALARALPSEPDAEDSRGLLVSLFQLPDGSRPKRRFLLSDRVQLLFDFVESVGAGGLAPDSYRLVTRFPRRVLQGGQEGTLQDAGLAPGQEVFVLEAS